MLPWWIWRGNIVQGFCSVLILRTHFATAVLISTVSLNFSFDIKWGFNPHNRQHQLPLLLCVCLRNLCSPHHHKAFCLEGFAQAHNVTQTMLRALGSFFLLFPRSAFEPYSAWIWILGTNSPNNMLMLINSNFHSIFIQQQNCCRRRLRYASSFQRQN
jgi:hypothetical protein